jgi:hypothetical protein
LFWKVIHLSSVGSKKIQDECIQSKACFEAAIQSEGKASCLMSCKRKKREGAEKPNVFNRKPSPMHSIESLLPFNLKPSPKPPFSLKGALHSAQSQEEIQQVERSIETKKSEKHRDQKATTEQNKNKWSVAYGYSDVLVNTCYDHG